MSVWHEVVRALRERDAQRYETSVEGRAMVILDREIRAADAELDAARDRQVAVMAAARLAQQRLEQLRGRLAEYEGYAEAALDQGNETLARDVAVHLASLEQQITVQRAEYEARSAAVSRLRTAVQRTETALARLHQQVDTIRAVEAVQRAQFDTSGESGDAPRPVHTALDSLALLRAEPAAAAVREQVEAIDALLGVEPQEVDVDAELDARLRRAGIRSDPDRPDADQILNRLRRRHAGEADG